MKKDKFAEFKQRLPMIEEPELGDPLKGIKSEFKHYRSYQNRKVKVDAHLNDQVMDLEKPLEKRRTEALLKSLETLTEEQKPYACDWVTVNIFTSTYAFQDEINHLMTAAAIWILDQLSDAAVPPAELCKLLPRDRDLLDDLFSVSIHDAQYSSELIASVEYVLRVRNQDIAPLESSGNALNRAFTSKLAAEGKCHADVPSRRNYEALIALIPQEKIDAAVARFKQCYEAWKERFFILIRYAVDEFEEKRKAVNDFRAQSNAERDRVEKLVRQHHKEYVEKHSKKKPTLSPEMLRNLDAISKNAAPMSLSAVSGGFIQKGSSLDAQLLSASRLLDDMAIKHEKLMDDFEEAAKRRGRVNHHMTNHGYMTEGEIAEDFSGIDPTVLTPLPFTNPFEMCFALLYLVEQDDEIPWLYGSCLGVINEVIDSLPWYASEYSELEDRFWMESDEDGGLHQRMLSDESATVTFPDWYRRDYRRKGEDTDEARNLAQILYEATGCLMPRNMHRYDRMMKELGRYGIRQNKAIAMLNCMEALGTSKHRQDALNLEEGFAAQFESNQKTAPKLTPAEIEAKNKSLEKELRELRSALHNAEKSNSELRKKLSQEKAQSEAEHRELADLREIVFKSDTDIVEETAEENNVVFPYTVQKTTVVFGGHDTWVKAIKPLLKGDIKFIPREMKIDVSLVRYADVIWIQTNAIPHRSYYSIVDTARKYHKPIRYFKFASASKCAEQILENEQ